VGGTVGQVLTKVSSTDYNTQWETPSGGSGSWDSDRILVDIDDGTVVCDIDDGTVVVSDT
jgi:hypothetical protein